VRVGYILKKFPRLSETFILNELLELERQGIEVTVFSLRRPDEELVHPGVSRLEGPVLYIPDRGALPREVVQNLLNFFKNRPDGLYEAFEDLLLFDAAKDPWRGLRSAVIVALEAHERKIDHFHAHFATVATEVANLAHQIGGTPFSFTAHAKDIYRKTVDAARFARLASRARFVITVCDANKRFIEERLVDERARVMRLYNGIALDYFDPTRRKPEEPPMILGVGRLVEKKGFDMLIRAAAGLEKRGLDLRVRIVGDGDQRDSLEALTTSLGTRCVKLLGAQTQEEVHRLMMRAAAIVLPCRVGEDGNRDALPTVLLEALAAGVPAVSTPVSGVPEILDDGRAGRIVPIDDLEALESAIAALLDDREVQRELTDVGRTRAEELFDLKKNVARLRGLFETGSVDGMAP